MNKYEPYSSSEIDVLLHEPWEISDQPYRLHAAYALSTLFDVCAPDMEEEDEFKAEDMWGCRIPKRIIDHLSNEIMTDFNDAATRYKTIRIWGKQYPVRKVNAYDHNRLNLVFAFPEENGDYIITKNGVLNLSGVISDSLKKYEITKDQASANRLYLRQIIKMAEDDLNNGWDRLTDMEIVLYCWGMFYNKHQADNFVLFKHKYKDYIYVKESDIMNCLNVKSAVRQRPTGMYAFSYEKVQEWNLINKQKSDAALIPPKEAEDYWYDVALKGTFKPSDQY